MQISARLCTYTLLVGVCCMHTTRYVGVMRKALGCVACVVDSKSAALIPPEALLALLSASCA